MTWKTYVNEVANLYRKLELRVKEVQTKRDDSTVVEELKESEFNKFETNIISAFTKMSECVEKPFSKFTEEYNSRVVKNLKNYRMILFKTVH